MAEMSAEQFAQRAFDLNLLDARQLETIWSELGSRDAPPDELRSLLVRKELLTNYQVEKLLSGKRGGFFHGDYKILYLIGAGTFARVYRAVHKDTGQVVAVKVLRSRYSDDLTKTDQFLREAKMVMTLRHPNIAPIFDVHSDRFSHYMVMEFVEGQNLRDFVKMRGKLEVAEALRIIADVASGLDYALKHGITHRDLKLSNALLASNGRAKLVDFGLAAGGKAAAEFTDTSSTPRSIDYAGLERATGVRKDDKRSDIYFTGCMLYHMLTGHAPLYETKDRVQRLSVTRFQEVKPIGHHEPNLPLRIVNLVNKAMELNPEKRYQTPGEMLADVKLAIKIISEGGDTTAPVEETIAAAAQGDVSAAPPAELEGKSHTVMVVESNVALQDILREKLKQLGYRVLVTVDPDRALGRFADDANLAGCIVFGTGELGEAAVDAFNRFATQEATKRVPAILLVDQKQKRLIKNAKLDELRVVVAMPLKFKEFRGVLKGLLARKAAVS
jgi:tRNA A-37 threonylcarbamoyl transferase component Bud32